MSKKRKELVYVFTVRWEDQTTDQWEGWIKLAPKKKDTRRTRGNYAVYNRRAALERK